MHLSELRERICIFGPPGSGKSTLADAIARKRGLEPVHLDQLHHVPNSNWQVRPAHEFLAAHAAAIARDRWVMDGNYSNCVPERLQRATGIILLDAPTFVSVIRYLRRTLLERERRGALEGGQDSVKWKMLHHIVVVTPKSRRRYAAMYRQIQLPKLYLPSMGAINRCYRQWELER